MSSSLSKEYISLKESMALRVPSLVFPKPLSKEPSKAFFSNKRVDLCHKLWLFPRYLRSAGSISMHGWQRETASTKVLSAEGWQSLWIMCAPEHMNGTSSLERLSRCFSLSICQTDGKKWSQTSSAKVWSICANWDIADKNWKKDRFNLPAPSGNTKNLSKLLFWRCNLWFDEIFLTKW